MGARFCGRELMSSRVVRDGNRVFSNLKSFPSREDRNVCSNRRDKRRVGFYCSKGNEPTGRTRLREGYWIVREEIRQIEDLFPTQRCVLDCVKMA